MKNRFKKAVLALAVYALIFLALFELVLRLLGYKPFSLYPVSFEYKPTYSHSPDSVLGYAPQPGQYMVIKDDTFTYTTTHDNDRHRITSFSTRPFKYKIVLLGCSFTYGECLNDSQTHPFLLQNKLPDSVKVENWGVGGYCPTQFYLQTLQVLKDTSVKMLVINYATFQNERTVMARSRRKLLVPYIKQKELIDKTQFPYFSLTHDSLELGRKYLAYTMWPLQNKLAAVEFLEGLYNKYEQRNADTITYMVMKKIVELVEVHHLKLIVTGIDFDDKTIRFLKKLHQQTGVETLYYDVNYNDNKFNLNPADGHPNYRANRIYADSLYARLLANGLLH